MLYEYTDEYLASGGVINDEMEQRAIKDIEQYGFTNTFYIEKLTILRTYIICCLENQTRENDLYEIKLKHYKDEFFQILQEAKFDKAQSDNQNGTGGGDSNKLLDRFNCPLSRG